MNNEHHIIINHKLANAIVCSHAVFNYLTAIQNRITFDQKRDAINGLSAYAKFLRKVISLVDLSEWTVKEEVELLDEYLQMEKIRFGELFDFSIDNNTPYQVLHVLLCIPFVELLVSASLKNNLKPVKLTISFEYSNNKLLLNVLINRMLPPFDIQERNDEQQGRFQLLNEKMKLCASEYTENITQKQTQYTLLINH
ncbi:MAG: histidine kinase [Bacteroidia bacterium]|nr:histidine kinase [Bacteroidia bacterium]